MEKEYKKLDGKFLDDLTKAVVEHGKKTILYAIDKIGEVWKYCPRCEKTLHEGKFYIRKNGYLSGWCKMCSSEADKIRRDKVK